MKTVRGWLTHAFNEIRLEEVPYPELKPGWAIVKTKVVQPSVTEVQLFYGERSNSYDKVKRPSPRARNSCLVTSFAPKLSTLMKRTNMACVRATA